MINQSYIFELMKERKIKTLSELSRILGVNYYNLRYGLNKGSLRLNLAVSIADFFKIPVSSLLISKEKQYIKCTQWKQKDINYQISSSGDIHYLMFCILNAEVL